MWLCASVTLVLKAVRELFKGLKDWASLAVCNEKNFFGWWLQIFYG